MKNSPPGLPDITSMTDEQYRTIRKIGFGQLWTTSCLIYAILYVPVHTRWGKVAFLVISVTFAISWYSYWMDYTIWSRVQARFAIEMERRLGHAPGLNEQEETESE